MKIRMNKRLNTFSLCLLCMFMLASKASGEGPYSTVIEAVNTPGLYPKSFLADEYNNSCTKYLFKAGASIEAVGEIGVEAFIDLDDYFGVTEEGQSGWVTTWLVGKLGMGLGLELPLGVVRLPGQTYDPDFYFELNILEGTILTELTNVEIVSGQTTNIDHLEFESFSAEISFSLCEAVFPIAKVEVKKSLLDASLKNAVQPGNPMSSLLFAEMFLEQLLPLMSGEPPVGLSRFATKTDLDLSNSNPSPPDLILENIYFYCAEDCTEVVAQGTQVSIQAFGLNVGQSDVTFDVSFYLDSISQGSLISRLSDIFLYGDYDPGHGYDSPFLTTVFWDTTTVTPGNHKIIVRIENASPPESDDANNTAYVGLVIIPCTPIASVVSISPNPAQQGQNSAMFIASANDTDDRGDPPDIRTYRWTSDLGKINGQQELYNGPNSSFSIPASDLRVGTHNISLTVQDNEGDWSEAVTEVLTINQAEPVEGHDVKVGLYVSQATVIHLPTQNVSGEIWASNLGDYSESGTLLVQLKNSSGNPLDSKSYPFSNLGQGQSTGHQSFSLSPGGYQGDAKVQAQATVEHDSDLSNNQISIPVYFSENLNPTDSFDGFELIEITSGETKSITDRNGQQHSLEFRGIKNSQGTQITIVIDDESFNPYIGDNILGLPWAVIQLGNRHVGVWTYGFYFWWPDNLYTFSTQNLTIPVGGTATFEISRTSGSWPTLTQSDVEFISGLLPGGWSSSASPQNGKLQVQVQVPHTSGTGTFLGWAHMHVSNGDVDNFTDAFGWMKMQAVCAAPETVVNSGPDGIIYTDSITFVWSGSDDTTPANQLQYAYRLEPLESTFSSFSTDTKKTYNNLEDGVYTFYVKARDLGGTEDPTQASRSFTIVTNHMPVLPVNIFPLSGQTELSLIPVLVGSEFFDADNGDTFAKSRFQIRVDTGTYDNPQWDSGELSPGTINVQVMQELAYDKMYWWRCRYQDSKGAWSPWSNETSFRTKVDLSKVSDFDKNGKVDFADFAIMASFWMESCSEPDWCNGCDLDRSGLIDIEDLYLFSQNWLKQYSYMVINLTQLTNGPLHETEPAFNAEGTKIVYRNLHEPYAWNQCDIWVMSIDGSNKTQITTDSRGEFAPSFVPDGRITYTKEFGSNDYDIWMVEGNGNNPQSFISGSYRQSNPKWNPGGTKVVYMSEYQHQGPAEIWIANADGTGKIKLTDHTVDGYGQSHPVFSHSGNFIAYANCTTSDAKLQTWIMNADGSGKHQITSEPARHNPMFWWPDDSRIGYIQENKVWLYDLSTGASEVLLEVPDASLGGWCDLSPNGSKLVFDLSSDSGTHLWIGDVVPK